MAGADSRHDVLAPGRLTGGWEDGSRPGPDQGPGASLSRRRFLAGLGLLAGAGAVAPLLGRMGAGAASSVEVSRPGLGTWIRIVARDHDRARASRAIERAYAAIGEVDVQMSIHRGDSEVAGVNRAAGAEQVAVGGDLIEVVGRARAAAERAGGI
ncbi:MAG TPA: FAD:protein FMN transferase, partial [Candidatus Eisenbacteria bacterium]